MLVTQLNKVNMKYSLRRILCSSLATLTGLTLWGCSGPQVQRYANESPKLDMSEYFNGTIDAYGIFTDRKGEVVKRFKVVIKAKWETKDGKDTCYLRYTLFLG